jgi:hypothetical protein
MVDDALTEKLQVVRHCLNGLAESEYSVSVTTDYKLAVRELIANGKEYLTPNMSPELNDFTGDNCKWHLLHFRGKIIGGIASRRDRIGDETLGSFWRRTMLRQYGQSRTEQIVSVASFIDEQVKGDITYFGDLLLQKEHRNRGSHLRLFTMYCQMYAAIGWNSDWQYSFISEKRAANGGAFTYGFTSVIPGAQKWVTPEPENRKSSECCVISSRVNLNDIARYFSTSPEKLRVTKDAG